MPVFTNYVFGNLGADVNDLQLLNIVSAFSTESKLHLLKSLLNYSHP